MGMSVKASCACGFEQPFRVGGGMMSFQELCLFPCLCRSCKQIVEANLLKTPLTCPVCDSPDVLPYDQGDLCEQQGSKVVASWNVKDAIGRELKLTDGAYYCPTCGTHRLRFLHGGRHWD